MNSEPVSHFLGYARLARVQAAFWGNPITTGWYFPGTSNQSRGRAVIELRGVRGSRVAFDISKVGTSNENKVMDATDCTGIGHHGTLPPCLCGSEEYDRTASG